MLPDQGATVVGSHGPGDFTGTPPGTTDRYGVEAVAISTHLTGQAVCDDPIDIRLQAIIGDHT